MYENRGKAPLDEKHGLPCQFLGIPRAAPGKFLFEPGLDGKLVLVRGATRGMARHIGEFH